MGLFGLGTKTKQQVLTDLLPVTVNNIYAQSFDSGYDEFMRQVKEVADYPLTFLRSKENMCEYCALLMAMQSRAWLSKVTDRSVAVGMVREMAAMIAATSSYSVNDYLQMMQRYSELCDQVPDPRGHITKQLVMRLEPIREDMGIHKKLMSAESNEGSFMWLGTIIFARLLDIIKMHEPLIDHINKAR